MINGIFHQDYRRVKTVEWNADKALDGRKDYHSKRHVQRKLGRVDGYSSVTVDVESPSFIELPANLMSYESGVTDLSHGFAVTNSSGTIESGTYTIDSYLTASNYPSPSAYTYLGYNTFANGEELPTISSDENYSYTWYATLDDAKAQTNPISVGIGNKIYCRFAAV